MDNNISIYHKGKLLVTLGRSIREKERIKVRQPLQKILVDGKFESLIKDLSPLIEEELNVKEVVFEKDLESFINFSLKPNFKVAGPALGQRIKEFSSFLVENDPHALLSALEENKEKEISLQDETFLITMEFIDVKVEAKEGFTAGMENNLFAILDTFVTDDLLMEGLARELVSKVQQMRKQKDFEMMDNIEIHISTDEEVLKAIEKFKDYIMEETLSLSVLSSDEGEDVDLNGHKAKLSIKKL